MAEYWKSTPKYWCKHCKSFIRDTKLERTNHEATPKHQGNIKRFLRDLHRGHEREERDQQRAKDEVNRLNGVVSGVPSASSGGNAPPWQRKTVIPQASIAAKQATPAERKQQLAQLAAMGVAVPEDFRREMAMAGDWQTVSERAVYDNVKAEEDSKGRRSLDTGEAQQVLNIGVRKRKFETQEEEEEAGERVVRKGWGSTTRMYPSADQDYDLDALLNTNQMEQRHLGGDSLGGSTPREQVTKDSKDEAATKFEAATSGPQIKKEGSDPILASSGIATERYGSPNLSAKEEELGVEVIFKKRKPKNIRQK